MNQPDTATDPDWDLSLELRLAPAALIHTLFYTASSVHTGWSSCVDPPLVLVETQAVDHASGNHCRLLEQEFVEEGQEDLVWHDWTVELVIGKVYVVGHWQLPASAPPMEWEWHSREAETAFTRACRLLGKRVGRGLVVEDPPAAEIVPPGARTH